MHVKIEGLDAGAWDFPWPQSPTTRQFLRNIPFEQCRMFASVGDAAAPAALVAASSFAEHATAFELTRPAADRFNRSALRNKLRNCTALSDELWQSQMTFDIIVARCFLTKGLFVDALAHLSSAGRLYIQSPALDGDWASEIRSWLPAGAPALLFSAAQSKGWLELRAERTGSVLETAA